MSVRKRKWTTSRGEPREGWVVDYIDQNRKRHHKSFKRKKDADAYAAKTHTEVLGNIHVADGDSITVAEAGEFWLASCYAANLERSTIEAYKQHLRLHIVPLIGNVKLSKITVPFVRQFLDLLHAQRRSDAMVRNVRVSLGSILSDAQERGLVVFNAVKEMGRVRRSTARVEARHHKRAEVGIDIPTLDEVRLILAHAEGIARIFLMTAVSTGMRASELRGLRWSDVKFERQEITVRQRADAYNEIGSPKSKAGWRTIPIGRELVQTLREWKIACPHSKLDLVFPNGRGNIEYHANILKRWLLPAQVKAGVVIHTGVQTNSVEPIVRPKYTGLHALRHFYASFCINRTQDGGLGLPPKVVQTRLGHSSIQMTLDVYGHLFPNGDRGAELDRAESALFQNN